MDNLIGIVTYHTKEYGHVAVKLKSALDSRGITRNRLRSLTGVKYNVIDRYYRSDNVRMVDLDFFAKVCCVLNCPLDELLGYKEPENSKPLLSAKNSSGFLLILTTVLSKPL